MQTPAKRIEVSVSDQKLRVLEGDEEVAEYPVSTSKFGLGSEEGTNKTPLGRFEISDKIGHDAEQGTVFKSREPVGRWQPGDIVDEDLVLTRILWLNGLEEENANTHDRYIYIHGTNQEERIGEPASYGRVGPRN